MHFGKKSVHSTFGIRNIIFSIVCLVVTLGVVIGTSMVPAHAAVKPKLGIILTGSNIEAGGTVRVTGVLTVASKPVAKSRISIQRKQVGNSKWQLLQSGITNSEGRYTVSVPKQEVNYDYRVLHYATKKVGAATSATKRSVVKQKVTLTKTSKTTATAGDYVTFTGRTSAGLAGNTWRIQQLKGSNWTNISSGKVNKSGTFSATARLTIPGKSKFRVAVVGSPEANAASSKQVYLSTYGWYYLSEMERVDSSRFGSLNSGLKIGGTNYSRSVGNNTNFWWNSTPYAEWNLGYKCLSFEATVGLSDDSPSAYLVGFTSKLDAVEADHGVMSIGKKMAVKVDTRGAFRLTLQDNYVAGPTGSGGATGIGAWGNARVLCLGAP